MASLMAMPTSSHQVLLLSRVATRPKEEWTSHLWYHPKLAHHPPQRTSPCPPRRCPGNPFRFRGKDAATCLWNHGTARFALLPVAFLRPSTSRHPRKSSAWLSKKAGRLNQQASANARRRNRSGWATGRTGQCPVTGDRRCHLTGYRRYPTNCRSPRCPPSCRLPVASVSPRETGLVVSKRASLPTRLASRKRRIVVCDNGHLNRRRGRRCRASTRRRCRRNFPPKQRVPPKYAPPTRSPHSPAPKATARVRCRKRTRGTRFSFL
mmetsp:Transcript_1163/g.4423  ORF Transcript_1163/g.4423 Transcript_1163/m.4423 type:complete len:265 (-) Transcript_1163:3459-4253(-)